MDDIGQPDGGPHQDRPYQHHKVVRSGQRLFCGRRDDQSDPDKTYSGKDLDGRFPAGGFDNERVHDPVLVGLNPGPAPADSTILIASDRSYIYE